MNRSGALLTAFFLFAATLVFAAGKPAYLRAYDGEIVDVALQAGTAGGIALVRPAEGAVVPLLSDGQKAYENIHFILAKKGDRFNESYYLYI